LQDTVTEAVFMAPRIIRLFNPFLTQLCYQAPVSLVHAILGIRASPSLFGGGRIPRIAWTR